LAKLTEVSGLGVFIVTNQSGVALLDPEYRRITEERVEEINKFIILKLKYDIGQQGGKPNRIIKAYACPFVDEEYAIKKLEDEKAINFHYVADHDWIKPRPGMVHEAWDEWEEMNKAKITRAYMAGDRASDVECGLRAGCHVNLLFPGYKTKPEDFVKIEDLKIHFDQQQVHVIDTEKGEDFYTLATIILQDIHNH